MNIINKIDAYITKISKFMCYCSAFSTVFLMFLIVSDALGRYIFSAPVNGATVLTRNVLVAITFLALPWVTATNSHLRSEMVVEKSKGRLKKILNSIAYFIGILVFFGYTSSFIKPTALVIMRSEMDIEGMAHIPLAPFYIICLISGILTLYQIVKVFILNIISKDNISAISRDEVEVVKI